MQPPHFVSKPYYRRKFARKAAAQRGENAVCGISLWEVAWLVDKKRIKLSIPLADWMAEVVGRLPILNITGNIAARCYDLGKFHGDPADRIITATALVHGLTISRKPDFHFNIPAFYP